MRFFDWLQEVAGIDVGTLIAGLAGAVLSLLHEPNLTRMKALGQVVSGVASAVYLTPLASEYLGLGVSTHNALAYVMGLVGMRVSGVLIKVVENPDLLFRVIRGKTKG